MTTNAHMLLCNRDNYAGTGIKIGLLKHVTYLMCNILLRGVRLTMMPTLIFTQGLACMSGIDSLPALMMHEYILWLVVEDKAIVFM